jgi:hypothetical protein
MGISQKSATQSRWWWWTAGALGYSIVQAAPMATAKIDMRGTAGRIFSIRQPHLSPPIAALEDGYRQWPAHLKEKQNSTPIVFLRAGKSGKSLLAEIAYALSPKIAAPPTSVATLGGITLGGRVASTTLKGMTLRQEPVVVAASATPVLVQSEVSPVAMDYSKRVELARELAAVDWRSNSFGDRAQKLVGQALRENPEGNSRTTDAGVYVAKPNNDSRGLLAAAPSAEPKSPARTVEPVELSRPAAAGSPVSTLTWRPRKPGPSSGPIRVTGALQFAGGLAVTGRERLIVFHDWDGSGQKPGQVWTDQGRYEVTVGSTEGRVVAQLVSSRGRVLGQGEASLAKLVNADATSGQLDIVLRPSVEGARIEVASAYSYDNQIVTVEGAQVWLDGARVPMQADRAGRWFSEAGLMAQSSFVARASAKNHWGSIVIGLGGEERRLQMFPNKLMEAFTRLAAGDDQARVKQDGVVWGVVTKDGKPVRGAHVELAGDHRLQPIYFSALQIPDRMAEATSENGNFAFVWVTPGIQSVRVVFEGRVYPAQVVPVDKNAVSHIEFELGDPNIIPLAVYDALENNHEVQAVLHLSGDESSSIEIQGQGRLGLPSGPGIVMLEADAGDLYEIMRYTVPRSTRDLRLPMVRRDWLVSLGAQRKINLQGGSGYVTGFSVPDDFVVRVEGDHKVDVVYLDNRGRPLFAEEGVAGGGFVIFNAPADLQTISITTKSSGQVFSQVMVIAPEVTNGIVF